VLTRTLTSLVLVPPLSLALLAPGSPASAEAARVTRAPVAAPVVGHENRVTGLPAGASGRGKRQVYYLDTGDQRGWLVLRRRGTQLVLATSWADSDGSCFVGDRSGRWFHGTFTALPGPSTAWVRLKHRYGGIPSRMLVDQRSRDYSPTSRVWTRAAAAEIRRLFDLPSNTSFAAQIADCL
jgi:hypothetical protein